MNIEGHYEVRGVEFGRIYRWCPESVSVGCDCGERLSLTSMTTCYRCGADHTAVVREELTARRSGNDKVLHP